MKKSFLLFSLLLITVIVSGCTYNKTEENTVTEKLEKTISDLPIPTAETTNNKQEATTAPQENKKNFTMTAKSWEFIPSVITVNEGDLVKLTIKSIDIEHGIYIPDFNVEANITPGQDTVVEFKTDKKGTFSFRCSVFCGEGHMGMTGTIIVE